MTTIATRLISSNVRRVRPTEPPFGSIGREPRRDRILSEVQQSATGMHGLAA